jgi:septum site-determining protein MinD
LPAAQTREKTAVTENQMKAVIDELAELRDYVIIDCPAGIEHGFRNALAGAREAIVVTTPEVSAIRDADRVIGKLNERGLPLRLVVNRIRPEMVRRATCSRSKTSATSSRPNCSASCPTMKK